MKNNKRFVVTSPLYKIVCLQDDWEHITKNHEIMSENEEALKDTLKNPLLVYESKAWTNRHIYFGKTHTATYGDSLLTKAVVEIPTASTSEGKVISAWPQKNVKGNLKEGGLIYVDGKLGHKK